VYLWSNDLFIGNILRASDGVKSLISNFIVSGTSSFSLGRSPTLNLVVLVLSISIAKLISGWTISNLVACILL